MTKIHDILKRFWGYDSFRPLQEDIITSVLDGHDTLALMPTGGGKSICFQVPALALEGVCIVVTPLIALMKDQVAQLKQRGIKAQALFSGMRPREIDIALDNCVYGDTKFLYLSPERLKTKLFQERLQKMNVSLLAVDEAHCISQWGYNFRPPYLTIAQVRKFIPDVPCIALTATATQNVCIDIQEHLEFREGHQFFRKSFARENLSYSCFKEENKLERLLKILRGVQGSSVVYVRNRRKTQEITELLRKQNVSADFYHAGLDMKERSQKQEAWIKNQIRVIVATNAFGMGIDKPDVRLVVHLDIPDNLEAYYQEAGRAGRDEQKAYAVLLYDQKDTEGLLQRLEMSHPSLEIIKRVYQAIANRYQIPVGSGELASYDFEMKELTKPYNLKATEVHYGLKRLEEQGLVHLTEAVFQSARLMVQVSREALET
ncbi:MAG: ATP-dependent DNA helicase RecQ [Bacteroidota bacterium]